MLHKYKVSYDSSDGRRLYKFFVTEEAARSFFVLKQQQQRNPNITKVEK